LYHRHRRGRLSERRGSPPRARVDVGASPHACAPESALTRARLTARLLRYFVVLVSIRAKNHGAPKTRTRQEWCEVGGYETFATIAFQRTEAVPHSWLSLPNSPLTGPASMGNPGLQRSCASVPPPRRRPRRARGFVALSAAALSVCLVSLPQGMSTSKPHGGLALLGHAW
jgi:hypothetical protein